MSGISWPDLIRFGLCDLKLEPDVFWSLTPAELMLMAGRDLRGSEIMTRNGMNALMTEFPDGAKET